MSYPFPPVRRQHRPPARLSRPEPPMTTAFAPSVLDSLVEDLRDAQVRLADARLAFEHSPNGDRLSWLQASRSHADALLDAYLEQR